MQAEDRAALESLAAADPEGARDLGSAWVRHMRAGDFARAWEVSNGLIRRRAGERCAHFSRHFQ